MADKFPPTGPLVMMDAGGQCATCGFLYWEHNGHIIACPVCENAALKVRLRAARSLLAHYANEFGARNFTDRYDDAGRCNREVSAIDEILADRNKPNAELTGRPLADGPGSAPG